MGLVGTALAGTGQVKLRRGRAEVTPSSQAHPLSGDRVPDIE